jgi:hypothetical protein
MRKPIHVAIPVFVLGIGFLLSSTVSFAKPEYTKTTKKACTVCHTDTKAKPKELTEAGKYFKDKKTLDGYTAK